MTPEFPRNQTPSTEAAVQPAKRRYIPRLFEVAVILFVLTVLAGLCLPMCNSVAVRSPRIRSLAQAKQIGLALKIFAGDNDGKYPGKGVPAMMGNAPTTSNTAFAALFPTYTTSERIFGNKLSAYQTKEPDDVIDNPAVFPPVKTLEPGENVYAYVTGLTDNSDPSTPIVLEGTDGTHLYYNSTPAVRGGVWEGKHTVVIYLDNHGALETLTGRENTRYIKVNTPGRPSNLLDFSWMGKDVHLLDPAVAP